MGCIHSKSRSRNRRLSKTISVDGPVTVVYPSKGSPTHSRYGRAQAYAASGVPASDLYDDPFIRGQAALQSNYAPSHQERTASHAPSHYENTPSHAPSHLEDMPSNAPLHHDYAESHAPPQHEDAPNHPPSHYDHPPSRRPSHQDQTPSRRPSDQEHNARSNHDRSPSQDPPRRERITRVPPPRQDLLTPHPYTPSRDREAARNNRRSIAPETEHEPPMSEYAPSVVRTAARSRDTPQTHERNIASALQNLGHTRLHSLRRPECFPRGSRPSFRSAYARAVRRYGFECGKHAGFAMRNNTLCKVAHTGETEHEVAADSEYVVPVTIGTPGITLHLDFDTGSSDLWIWSSEIAHASEYGAHRIYNPRKSSSARRGHASWELSYGDGSSASGDVYTDVIDVAGVRVPDQAIELAHTLSSSFLQDGGSDGLLGLAWPSLNSVKPHKVATPVQNMIDKHIISLPVFTVKLGHGSEQSFYSFGFIDEHACHTKIKYTDVDNSQGFWQVPSPAWSLNSKQRARKGNTAIIDTGTTLCLVADEIVEEIYGSIKGATYDGTHGGWKYPSTSKPPRVALAVGDYLYHIHPTDFGFSDAGNGYIMGGIQSRGDSKFDILGDVWLKSVYVVFNQGEKKVGVGQRDD